MNTLLVCALTLGMAAASLITPVQASTPEEDLNNFQTYFKKRFPNVTWEDFGNGAYALDKAARENWEAIEEFPPYEPFIDEGREIWDQPFANGKSLKDCLPDGPAIVTRYPYWNKERGMVMTLSLAINECREANGEKPFPEKIGKLASLLAFMAYESRGQIINVTIPADDPKALEAYNKGKQFYFARRGQLNFACIHCHGNLSGTQLRTEVLSPALGHATHFPVYRSKWGELGTLHRRFAGCNEQVRAKAFKPQSEEYRDLEFFLTYMNNGQPINGPAARK